MSWNYMTLSYHDIDINPTVPPVSIYKAMTNGKHLGRYILPNVLDFKVWQTNFDFFTFFS